MRLSQRLGISLLELTTFAHAFCALAMYLAWWRKPLDVEEAVQIPIIPNSEPGFYIAAMCEDTEISGKKDVEFWKLNHNREPRSGHCRISIRPLKDKDGLFEDGWGLGP